MVESREVEKSTPQEQQQITHSEISNEMDVLQPVAYPCSTSNNGATSDPVVQGGRGKKRPLDQDKTSTPPKKKFRCSTCEREFDRSFNLKRHEKTHQGVQKTFECSHCQKKFASQFNKNRHEREVHKEQFKCSKCVMVYDNKDDFMTHVRTAHKKRKLQEVEDNSGK